MLRYPPTRVPVNRSRLAKPTITTANSSPDPYRWLETTTDPKTVAWIAAQNKVTEEVLSGVVEPHRSSRPN